RDTEIGRLLASLPPAQRADTVVFFVGDNGTPRGATDVAVFPRDHTKSTFYEGGLRVPLIVAGAGISRQGHRESALITATDFFATLADVTGASAPVPTSSSSFRATFTTSGSGVRTHAYAEELNDGVFHWAIRDARYKLLQGANGVQELYDLRVDLREENNLLPGDAAMQAIAAGLSQATQTIR
ncbi:MAG: sulfatase-like hydrolase/transferase, partial [Planctomycetota bacterium]|nr:sulfatase-like hydrolase/transferase [Planctomycetota bacterium]